MTILRHIWEWFFGTEEDDLRRYGDVPHEYEPYDS
jgi:hypothetical protein